MLPDALAERLRRIRFSQTAVAKAADLPPNTVSRILMGAVDARMSNVQAIERALLEEERRLRDYLVSLHGCPESKGEAA